jgi:hypothetical protein
MQQLTRLYLDVIAALQAKIAADKVLNDAVAAISTKAAAEAALEDRSSHRQQQ